MLDLNAHVTSGLTLPVLIRLDHDDCLDGLRFRAGDILVVDREAAPRPGCVVIRRSESGDHNVALFEPKVRRHGLYAVGGIDESIIGVVEYAVVSVCSVRATAFSGGGAALAAGGGLKTAQT